MATNIAIDPDDSRADTYGPNAQGIVIFDSSGRFTLVTTRSDLPKFASNKRAKGTADENRAVVAGSLANCGSAEREQRAPMSIGVKTTFAYATSDA